MGLFKKFVNQTRKPEGFLGKVMLGGIFMKKSEAGWMGLSGSALLTGRK